MSNSLIKPPHTNPTVLELGLLLERADLELGAVLLEHALAVVLPELLGGVLAGHALEDLCAARVVVEEACGLRRLAAVFPLRRRICFQADFWWSPPLGDSTNKGGEGKHTGNVVDAVVDNDEHALLVLVLGDLGLGVLLGHGGGCCVEGRKTNNLTGRDVAET